MKIYGNLEMEGEIQNVVFEELTLPKDLPDAEEEIQDDEEQ